MTDVRALTLWRPWPALIIHHGKDVENRPWTTRWRGPLVIHAGRAVDKQVLRQLGGPGSDLTSEGYIGVVEVADIHHATGCGGSCSDWAAPDGYHWMLANPLPFTAPLPGTGARGLFHPPEQIIAAVREAEEHAERAEARLGIHENELRGRIADLEQGKTEAADYIARLDTENEALRGLAKELLSEQIRNDPNLSDKARQRLLDRRRRWQQLIPDFLADLETAQAVQENDRNGQPQGFDPEGADENGFLAEVPRPGIRPRAHRRPVPRRSSPPLSAGRGERGTAEIQCDSYRECR